MVLGDGAREQGARCDRIPTGLQGVGYVRIDGVREPTRVRAGHVTDEDIARLVVDYAAPRPGLDGEALFTAAERDTVMTEVCAITAAPLQPPKRDPRDRRLAACAHTFGYRGHCLTKSRFYSTRFKDLRQARVDHVRAQQLAHLDSEQRELAELEHAARITAFAFAGIGHLTTADAYLAAQAATRAREHRELAREALTTTHNQRPGDRCAAAQDPSIAA
jgi:hypothetical protein